MKTVVLRGIRGMELRDAEMPKIQAKTDVLLKVGVVGVCGSDVHYYTTGRIGSQIVKYPFRVGHEFAATVHETGSLVTMIRPGDRVAVDPAMSCGECDQCRSGRRHTCRRLRFLGCPGQAEGCLAEYVVMPEACCFPLGRSMSLEQGALAEPLSIGLYATRLAGVLPAWKIAVLGTGPIGLSVILCAKALGVEKIYATDRIQARLDAARRAGAIWTGNPEKEDVRGAIADAEPLLLDAVFECCGQQEALDQAVELLKPGGRLAIVGIPETDRVSFSIDLLRRKEISIQNVRRQNECFQEAINLIESGKVKPDFMVTHRFRLEHAKEAFDLVASYGDGVVKAMIKV